jgi:DtxR family Mn-dependent transcriptional regulator
MPEIEQLPAGSSRQRHHLNHQAIEDYLKTIFDLSLEEMPVSTSRLAEARDVRPASVTSMLQRLESLNLVNYEKHYGVSLTEAGRKLALEVIRHHRLIELYLMEALGFSWDEVHEQAEILEHVISEKLEERISEVLEDPKFDPHGAPIPSKEGTITRRETAPLVTFGPGDQVRVARISQDEDVEMLRYLAEIGLVPGVEMQISSTAPFKGPVTVVIDGVQVVVGYNVASAVEVEVTG